MSRYKGSLKRTVLTKDNDALTCLTEKNCCQLCLYVTKHFSINGSSLWCEKFRFVSIVKMWGYFNLNNYSTSTL